MANAELLQKVRESGIGLRTVASRAGLTYGYVAQLSGGFTGGSEDARTKLIRAVQGIARDIEKFNPEETTAWELKDRIGLNISEIARRCGTTPENMRQLFHSGFRSEQSRKRVLKVLHTLRRDLSRLANQ